MGVRVGQDLGEGKGSWVDVGDLGRAGWAKDGVVEVDGEVAQQGDPRGKAKPSRGTARAELEEPPGAASNHGY